MPARKVVFSTILAFAGCLGFEAAQADIFRWDNAQLIPGTEGIALGPGVQLDHLVLEYAALDARDLSTANFQGSNLNNAALNAATLAGANLTDATVSGARFSNTTSRGFTKEQLYSTASYQQKDSHGIHLASNNLTGWDFSNQNLAGAELIFAVLDSAKFARANLTNANLGFATLKAADFTAARLSNANLFAATMTDVVADDSQVTGADLSFATLINARLPRADLSHANLSHTVLINANLDAAILADARLDGAALHGASLAGANFSRANLAGTGAPFANLAAANLTNANLAGASFTSANLSFTDARGAVGLSAQDALTRNMIWPDGHIDRLSLLASEQFAIRDYAGDPERETPANAVMMVGPLTMAATSRLDVGHTSVIIRGENLPKVAEMLARGFHGGDWLGDGVTSSAAANDPSKFSALGLMSNHWDDSRPYYTIFADYSVQPSDLLIRYTTIGDADLNGLVDGDDLTRLLIAYGRPGRVWSDGDFDFNGVIDRQDLNLLLSGYAHQGASLGASAVVAAVPEPRSLSLLAVGFVAVSVGGKRFRRADRDERR